MHVSFPGITTFKQTPIRAPRQPRRSSIASRLMMHITSAWHCLRPSRTATPDPLLSADVVMVCGHKMGTDTPDPSSLDQLIAAGLKAKNLTPDTAQSPAAQSPVIESLHAYQCHLNDDEAIVCNTTPHEEPVSQSDEDDLPKPTSPYQIVSTTTNHCKPIPIYEIGLLLATSPHRFTTDFLTHLSSDPNPHFLLVIGYLSQPNGNGGIHPLIAHRLETSTLDDVLAYFGHCHPTHHETLIPHIKRCLSNSTLTKDHIKTILSQINESNNRSVYRHHTTTHDTIHQKVMVLWQQYQGPVRDYLTDIFTYKSTSPSVRTSPPPHINYLDWALLGAANLTTDTTSSPPHTTEPTLASPECPVQPVTLFPGGSHSPDGSAPLPAHTFRHTDCDPLPESDSDDKSIAPTPPRPSSAEPPKPTTNTPPSPRPASPLSPPPASPLSPRPATPPSPRQALSPSPPPASPLSPRQAPSPSPRQALDHSPRPAAPASPRVATPPSPRVATPPADSNLSVSPRSMWSSYDQGQTEPVAPHPSPVTPGHSPSRHGGPPPPSPVTTGHSPSRHAGPPPPSPVATGRVTSPRPRRAIVLPPHPPTYPHPSPSNDAAQNRRTLWTQPEKAENTIGKDPVVDSHRLTYPHPSPSHYAAHNRHTLSIQPEKAENTSVTCQLYGHLEGLEWGKAFNAFMANKVTAITDLPYVKVTTTTGQSIDNSYWTILTTTTDDEWVILQNQNKPDTFLLAKKSLQPAKDSVTAPPNHPLNEWLRMLLGYDARPRTTYDIPVS